MPSPTHLRLGAILLLLLGATSPVAAGHPLVTDDAGTVAPRALELELASGVRGGFSDGCRDVGLALRSGLTPRMDLGVAVGLLDWTGSASVVQSCLDLKLRLVDPRPSRPGVFLRADFAAPDDALLADLEWGQAVVGGSWVGARHEIHAEVALRDAAPFSGDSLLRWDAGVAVHRTLGRSWAMVGELRREALGETGAADLLLGLVHELGAGPVLSLGVGTSLRGGDDAERGRLLLGITHELGL